MNRINCGDHVLHRPSGEEWVVAAADHTNDQLMWCGWPEGCAKISDCRVIRRAAPWEAAMLHAQLSGARRAMADRVYGPTFTIEQTDIPGLYRINGGPEITINQLRQILSEPKM
jgi:hypothetical protein